MKPSTVCFSAAKGGFSLSLDFQGKMSSNMTVSWCQAWRSSLRTKHGTRINCLPIRGCGIWSVEMKSSEVPIPALAKADVDLHGGVATWLESVPEKRDHCERNCLRRHRPGLCSFRSLCGYPLLRMVLCDRREYRQAQILRCAPSRPR
jgi:hypothetical protein